MAGHSDSTVSAADPLLRIQEWSRARAKPALDTASISARQCRKKLSKCGRSTALTLPSKRKTKGRSCLGKLADFAVLRKDPRKVAPDNIKDIIVDATYVGGNNIWQAPKNALAVIHHLVLGIDFGDGDEERQPQPCRQINYSSPLFRLTTSDTVKAAMLRDAGSRDGAFLETVREIRQSLLAIGGAAAPDYECVLMQGSGTSLSNRSFPQPIPPGWQAARAGERGLRTPHCANGAHPRNRNRSAGSFRGPPHRAGSCGGASRGSLRGPTDVAVIHCETTTGILNPIEEIGAVVERAGAAYIVDAMSSFGAIPIDLARARIDFLISSANKCIEGVPGFGFILARRGPLLEAKGRARTLSLDLHAQWAGFESDGQFRFTPPTHVLLAFHQALLELQAEGGVAGRAARYRANHATLMRGMEELGFEAYLAPEDRSYIITTFRYPADPRFHFEELYTRLSRPRLHRLSWQADR